MIIIFGQKPKVIFDNKRSFYFGCHEGRYMKTRMTMSIMTMRLLCKNMQARLVLTFHTIRLRKCSLRNYNRYARVLQVSIYAVDTDVLEHGNAVPKMHTAIYASPVSERIFQSACTTV